jgi:hypothetical protein
MDPRPQEGNLKTFKVHQAEAIPVERCFQVGPEVEGSPLIAHIAVAGIKVIHQLHHRQLLRTCSTKPHRSKLLGNMMDSNPGTVFVPFIQPSDMPTKDS